MTEAEKKAEEYCKNSKDFVKYTSETYKKRLKKAYLDGFTEEWKENMTDEEKAEEYCKNSKDFVKYTSETYKKRLKKAYLDGLAEGREKSGRK